MFLYTYEDILHDIKQRNLKEDEYIIVDDLEHCDESALDRDKKIYVRNLSPNNVICNSNTRMMLDYLRSQGYNVDLFFKNYTTHSMAFLDDYYKWMSYDDYIEFVEALLEFTGQRNPRILRNYGKIAFEKDQTFANFLQIMLRFVGVQTIYELIPVVNRNYDNNLSFQYITQEKTINGKYKITLLYKHFDNFITGTPFWDGFWAVGLLEGAPRRKNLNYAEANIVYHKSDIITVLKRDYAYLGLQVEENKNSIYINGKEYARKVVLQKERIKCKYSLSKNIINIFQNVMNTNKSINPQSREIYSAHPIEFHHIQRDELDDLLKNRQANIGYQVMRDLIDEREGFVLKEGEIFNLPYSRFEFTIDVKDKLPLAKENALSKNVNTLKIHLSKLRNQVLELEHANELVRCQAKAAEEARKELEDLNRTLEQKVKERTLELEEASKQKTKFFINLAHETKTPLTLIKNFLDQYIDKVGITEELQVIRQNINKLCCDMVNFLDAEKLEKGQVFYNHDQVFELSEMVKQKVLLFQEIARKKGITIAERIEEKLHLQADPFAIDRVINNLLDNAIRYTNHGGSIEVLLRAEGARIQLQVIDTGIGISEDRQQYIFDPYYQISHEKRNVQGIGIGLSIVKKILDSLNATIEVKSQPNQGSQFTVSFTRHTLQEQEVVQQDLTYSTPVDNTFVFELQEGGILENRYNVFLVEDNINLLHYLQSHIGETYNVFWATNGKEALEKLQNIPKPDIIVADIMMDVMDGYQFHEELSKTEQYKDIPCIFLTAKTSINEKLKGLSSGAIDYIYKPFSIYELSTKIASIIRNQNIKKALYEKDKYATIGMLFGEVAHEILKPLGGVYAPLENLEKHCKKLTRNNNKKLNGYFERAYNNLQRIEDLINSLKILCYKKDIEIEHVNIEDIIRSVIDIFQHTLTNEITINYRIAKDVEIRGNRDALTHIMLNLLSNAIDAIQGKGKINIIVENTNMRPVIRIQDTGCGINGKDVDHIFDAFYTSKPVSKGSGLGLYIVKELVLKLGWHIAVQSIEGKWTEVLITT